VARRDGIACVLGLIVVLPRFGRAATVDALGVGEVAAQDVRARGGVAWKQGEVPLFRASSRDLISGFVDVGWQPADRVALGLSWRGGASWTALGRTVPEPGRVTLRSRVELAPARESALSLQAGWRASVPLQPAARDSADTGEADVDLLVAFGHRGERWRLFGMGGIGIIGNPLLDGAQDDLPLLWLTAGATLGAVDLDLRGGGAIASSRNPGRTDLTLSVERQGRLLVGAQAGVGLSPAAADLALAAWTGVAWGCRGDCGD